MDNTDEQQISLAGNIITLGNGTAADTTVDLTGFVNTDEQDLENFQVNGTNLEISIEDGNTVSVPLSNFDSTVKQIVTTGNKIAEHTGACLLYTSDAADE